MSILLVIIALSILIVVHEFGHYLAARWMGVHVEVFSVGYGKRLIGKEIAGTDFRISAFPLGGYAKMYGDITEDVASDMIKKQKKVAVEAVAPEKEKEEVKEEIPIEKSFFHKKRWQRAIILIGGSVFNILLAILFIWIANLAGREIPAYKTEPPVLGGVVEGSPAEQAGLKAGDRILEINGEKMETWEETEIYILINPKDKLSIEAKRNGDIITFSVQPKEVTKNKVGYIGLLRNIPLYVGSVIEGSEAERMGLKEGDIIKKINGQRINYWLEGVEKIGESANKKISLVVERDGKEMSLTGTPEPYENPETKETEGKLGFIPTPPTTTKSYGILDGFAASIQENIRYTKLFFVSLGKLLVGKLSIRTMSGPIEITRISLKVAEQGLLPLIFLMGFISLALGIFNLLPIPMLDGGAIFIIILEGIRRKDFSLTTKERILQIGFLFIVALVVVIFYNDIVKLLF